MNESSRCPKTKFVVYTVAILGSLLIMAGMVRLMQKRTSAGTMGTELSLEREKALATVRAETEQVLKNYAWQDQAKGLVHLPIDRAMELVLQEWQDPKTARSNLLARADKAAAPAPKLPEKPSEFE